MTNTPLISGSEWMMCNIAACSRLWDDLIASAFRSCTRSSTLSHLDLSGKNFYRMFAGYLTYVLEVPANVLHRDLVSDPRETNEQQGRHD